MIEARSSESRNGFLACRVVFKTGILCSVQNRTDLLGAIGEKKDGEFFWIGSGGQHRVMARGVEAEDD